MADSEGDIWIGIRADLDDLAKEMAAARKGVDKESKSMAKSLNDMGEAAVQAGVQFAKMAAAAVAAIGAVGGSLVAFGSISARELTLAADRLGLTATRLNDLEAVAANYNIEADRLRDGFKDLSERIADAALIGGSYEEFLNQAGLKSKELIALPVDEQFMAVADGIAAMNSEAQQNLVAVNLMGDAGFELLNMMKQGSDAINSQVQAFKDLRGEMSELDIARAATFSESLGEMKTLAGDLAILFASEVGPAITFMVEQMKAWITNAGGAGQIMAKVGGIVETAMKIAGDAVAGFKVIWAALEVAITQLSVWIWSAVREIVEAWNWWGSVFEKGGAGMSLLWGQVIGGIKTLFADAVIKISEGMMAIGSRMADAGIAGSDSFIGAAGSMRAAVGGMKADVSRDISELQQKFDQIAVGSGETPFLDQMVDAAKAANDAAGQGLDQAVAGSTSPQGTAGDALAADFALFQEDLNARLSAQIEADEMQKEQRDLVAEQKKAEMAAEKALLDEHRASIIKGEQDAQMRTRAIWESGWKGKAQIASGILGNLSVLMQSENRKMFEIGKAAATSQAVIDTIGSAQSSFASLAGIPIVGPALGAAAAAAAIAAGTLRVQQIQSQSFGGGGSPSNAGGGSAGGSAGAQAAAPAAIEQTNVNVGLSGDSFSRDQVIGLVSAINDVSGDNVKLGVQSA